MTNQYYELIDVLIDHKVEFVIIGGLAVNAHGHIRATEDVDILADPSRENRQRIAAAVEKLNAFWITDQVDPTTGLERTKLADETYVLRHNLLMLGTDLGFLDIFFFVPGMPDESVRAVLDDHATLGGRRFVSLAWLRRMKQASGRPVDLQDLENLPDSEI